MEEVGVVKFSAGMLAVLSNLAIILSLLSIVDEAVVVVAVVVAVVVVVPLASADVALLVR